MRWLLGVVLCFGLLCSTVAIAQETITYSYDPLGRLVTAIKAGGPNSGQATTIAYDAASNRSNYAISGLPAAVLSVGSASANEGSLLTFTVTRTGNTALAASASWATSNGTAVAGTNYTASSGSVSFAAGATTATLTVQTIDDHAYTGNLSMAITLSAPSAGATLGTASASGTIINVDPNNAILSIAGASANEGTTLSFPVTRTGNTTNAASASWSTSNGTAVAGTNYTASTGTVSFAAGATAAAISVSTLDDNVVTANMAMNITLSAPSSGSSLGTASATGTIVNVDTGITLSIGNASSPEGSALKFTVTRSGSTTSMVSAHWATSNGTAVAGTNYTAASGTIYIAAGATTGVITVSTIDDCVVTSSKTVYVNLTSPSTGVAISGSSGLGTITNIDTTSCI